jgi:hypothetical protein
MASWTRSWLSLGFVLVACGEGELALESVDGCGEQGCSTRAELVASRTLPPLTTPESYVDTCGRVVTPDQDARPCLLAPWKDQFAQARVAELVGQPARFAAPDASSLQRDASSAYFLARVSAASGYQLVSVDLTGEVPNLRDTRLLWSGAIDRYDHFELTEVRHGMIAAFSRDVRADDELVLLDLTTGDEVLRWDSGKSKIMSAALAADALWVTSFENGCHVRRFSLDGASEDVTADFLDVSGEALGSFQQCVMGEAEGSLYVVAGGYRDGQRLTEGRLLAYELDAGGVPELQFQTQLALEIRGFGADRLSIAQGKVVLRTSDGLDVVDTLQHAQVQHIELEGATAHVLRDGQLYVGGFRGTIQVYALAPEGPRHVHTLLGASTGLALWGDELVHADAQVFQSTDLGALPRMLRFDPVAGSAGRCQGGGESVVCTQPGRQLVLYREDASGYTSAGESVATSVAAPVSSEDATALLLGGAIHVFDHATGTSRIVTAAPGESIRSLHALDGLDLLYEYACAAGQQCFRVLDLAQLVRQESVTRTGTSDALLHHGQLFAADRAGHSLLAYPAGAVGPVAALATLPLALAEVARSRLLELGGDMLFAPGSTSDFVVDVRDAEAMSVVHTLPHWPASKDRALASGSEAQLLMVDGEGANARAYDLVQGLPYERLAAPHWLDGNLQLSQRGRLRLLLNGAGFYASAQPLPAASESTSP